jgi:glycosyltransferase involved in cell wall biosynthesis
MERITRVVRSLNLFDEIVWIGVSEQGLPSEEQVAPGHRIVRLPRTGVRLLGFARKVTATFAWSLRVLWACRNLSVTCVNCHSLPVLPISVILKMLHGAKLVYDTHELETETTTSRGIRRPLLKMVERALIGCADVVSVVSPSIGNWYRDAYRLDDLYVVRNLSDVPSAAPMPDRRTLRRRFGIADSDFVFLYLGVVAPGRRIEQFIRVFQAGPKDRHLVIMGYGPQQADVEVAERSYSNIHFLPAVPPSEVLAYSSSADVGLCGVENACLSYYYSLPNKLFEYLSAGVPAIAPDFPEMRAIIEQYSCGWVVGESDDAWLRVINSVDRPSLSSAREGAADAAVRYSWQNEKGELVHLYRRLFSRERMTALAMEV